MTKWIATICMGLLVFSGCSQQAGLETAAATGGSLAHPETPTASRNASPAAPANQTASPTQVVARIDGHPITIEQLQRPLIDAHGLTFLLHLVQLELCKQQAREAGIIVTPEDVANERLRNLETLFKETIDLDGAKLTEQEKVEFRRKEYERLLDQLLNIQRISQPEFDLAMETGAYLRKLADRGLKEQITDEHCREGFRIMYGEKVRVRHIQLSNRIEAAEARRRLNDGEPFEQVAAEMSRDERSRYRGGEVRPFSRAEPLWPPAFKDAAFELQNPSDISEDIITGDAWHIIRLEQRIPPNEAIRYEDHKEIVLEELYSRLLQVRIGQLRENLVDQARRSLHIVDPVLKRQYAERMQRAAGAAGAASGDPDQIRRSIELDRPRPQADTTLEGEGRSEVARPPATTPGQ